MKIKISNGRVIDPKNNLDQVTDICIASGKIISIGDSAENFKADTIINAADKIVLPGIIDLCARMSEPGYQQTANILSESKAAVAGGVTTVCCPPDTNPIIDTPAVAELINQRAQAANNCKILPIAAATHNLDGKTLSEMHTLKNIGCVAISNAYHPYSDNEILRRTMEYAFTTEMPLILFCEDPNLKNHGTAHEGKVSLMLGLPGIPSIAETTSISQAILLAEHTGQCIHISHLSSAKSVELVKEAKLKQLPITADVSIHNLYLTESDLIGYNSACHLRPPLRTEEDRLALIEGIKQGVIDCICSDHQPHNDDAKSAPFSLTEPGASSIEHFLPLVMKLHDLFSIDISILLKSITTNPAEFLKLNTGNLSIDSTADIVIYDPNLTFTIEANTMISAGKNTAFGNHELPGQVTNTLVDGNIVFER